MIDILIWIWILVFFIFIGVGVVERSTTFGAIAGFWLLIFGLIIITTGVQVQSGATITTEGDTQVVTFSYTDATMPFGTYSFVWGLTIIAVSLYIIYANVTTRIT